MHHETSPVVTIVSAAGRYADPWHPFAETSECLAETLRQAGLTPTVTDDVDGTLADLTTVDLLVVNVGNPKEVTPADEAVRAGLLDYAARGGAVLAMHVSSTSFPGVPEWESILGGIWVRGTTMHPPLDTAQVHTYPERHEIVHGLHDFELDDERYSNLRVSERATVLADHEHEGRRHPLVWVHTAGGARVVYDALGHDERSFRSAEHRLLLQRAAHWLLGRTAAAGDRAAADDPGRDA